MSDADLGFLEVEGFLDGHIRREALHAALEHGVIDLLASEGPKARADLLAARRLHARQGAILLDLLVGHGVLSASGARVALSPRFSRALGYRDLLETQLDYGRGASRALSASFSPSVRDLDAHMAALVGFFEYDRRSEPPAAAVQRAEPWVRYMSTLTRYQAPLLIERLDLTGHRRVLDVGGNNGELATALCRAAPALEVTVVDLPAVCAIGARHVRARGLGDRIHFVAADATRGALPAGADLVIFKSVLHDFPDAAALRMLDAAAAATAPGARVAIFEMQARDLASRALAEHEIVNLPFLTCLREASFYAGALEARGFAEIQAVPVDPLHFLLVTARRAQTGGPG